MKTPTCRYHSTRMQLSTEKIAFRDNDNPNDLREVFRCPVVVDRSTGRRCPWVELKEDTERVEIRRCKKCGKRLRDEGCGRLQCDKCSYQSSLGTRRDMDRRRHSVGLHARYLTRLARGAA